MKTKNSRIILVVIVCLAVLSCVFAIWKLYGTPISTSPFAPRVVSAVKVPDGWYEHMVELEGAPPPTLIVLTKNAILPIRNAGDGQYDDPQITITSTTATNTPEEYIAQEGLSGANADAMGIKGAWSTFMGRTMFTIDLDRVGHTTFLFGNDTVYTFTLSATDTQDMNDFQEVVQYYAQPEFYAGTNGWKTYTDPSTGFTMQYPPQYAAQVSPPPAEWGNRTLVQIYNPASTSTGEFAIGPAQVIVEKQPIVASGAVYDTIAAYQNSGTAAQMVQGSPNPNGDLMTIQSGEQGLFYSFPANRDTGADPGDIFFFIKDKLIYEVDFDANDANEQAMLESIAWR